MLNSCVSRLNLSVSLRCWQIGIILLLGLDLSDIEIVDWLIIITFRDLRQCSLNRIVGLNLVQKQTFVKLQRNSFALTLHLRLLFVFSFFQRI